MINEPLPQSKPSNLWIYSFNIFQPPVPTSPWKSSTNELWNELFQTTSTYWNQPRPGFFLRHSHQLGKPYSRITRSDETSWHHLRGEDPNVSKVSQLPGRFSIQLWMAIGLLLTIKQWNLVGYRCAPSDGYDMHVSSSTFCPTPYNFPASCKGVLSW